MKSVIQEIPQSQQEIIVEALNLMEVALKTLVKNDDMDIHHKVFDILTLKAMLNKTQLVVKLPFEVYGNFTAINGVDFPEYSKEATVLDALPEERRYLMDLDYVCNYFSIASNFQKRYVYEYYQKKFNLDNEANFVPSVEAFEEIKGMVVNNAYTTA